MLRLVDGYLESLRVKGYSPRTLSSRASYLRAFVRWCEERAITRPVDVTRPVVERYQRWLYHYRKKNGAALSISAQSGRIISVRMWFRWLARQNLVAYNPAAEVELPRKPQRLPKPVLTIDEAEAVLRRPDVRTALGLRDRAILEVLYSTGMRRAELVGLDLADIDAERGTVLIRQGKGHKDRMVPIGERALWWIEKYLAEARTELTVEATRGAVFVTGTGERISAAWLTEVVKKYVASAGVRKAGSCHLFRHTCATLMLEGGADVRFIQQLLGHAALSTTEIYTRVSIQRLKAVHEATHPARLSVEPTREALEAALTAEADEEANGD